MKNLGILINFDKEIDKFIERFNNSFENCKDRITWEYIHYSQLEKPETFDILKKMDGLLLTGSYNMLSDKKTIEKYQPEMKIIREYEKPILGICFGIQLIASAFGFEITAINNPRFNQWRAGNSMGLLPILPLSLPKAITDPEKVIAPIKIPTYNSIS